MNLTKRKGITPVISIIILLLIAIALAGAAWMFMSGLVGGFMRGSVSIVMAECLPDPHAPSTVGTIILRNQGNADISLGSINLCDLAPAPIYGDPMIKTPSKTCGALRIERTDGKAMNAYLDKYTIGPGEDVTFRDRNCNISAGPMACTYRFRVVGGAIGAITATVYCG